MSYFLEAVYFQKSLQYLEKIVVFYYKLFEKIVVIVFNKI